MRNEKHRRVTLQDIARETGYSVNTVSHALRDIPDIAAATAQHIRQVAQSMGYAPNQLASSLRSGRTQVIAVILSNMSNPFYSIMTDAIQDCAMRAGYSLMIMCSRDDPDLEYQLTEQAISRRVDGILLFPHAYSQRTIQRLKEASLPFVLMFRYLERDQADAIVCDEEQGAYLATMHLLEHGLRKLAYISGDTILYSSEYRIRGFLKACQEAGLEEADRRICVMSQDHGTAVPQQEGKPVPAEALMELKRDGFNGLFVFSDVQAWRVLKTLQTTPGISPDDFGIVSFDNIEDPLSLPIPLCSVDFSYPEMARQGLELLQARMLGDNRPVQTIVCPVRLVCRGTCHRSRR